MTVTPQVRKLEATANYGKFDIEPLEPGFGTTLGNTLRRVLLSSLWGAAVTSIQIDGVAHEFTAIPHVKEDVTEVILNLKKLCLKSFTEEKTRVGQSTDFDRLIIEVWTDGTMSPEEAVSHAAELFTKHLDLFVHFGESIQKPSADTEKTGQNRLMDTPIEELDLSVRAFNRLKANEIQTVGH